MLEKGVSSHIVGNGATTRSIIVFLVRAALLPPGLGSALLLTAQAPSHRRPFVRYRLAAKHSVTRPNTCRPCRIR